MRNHLIGITVLGILVAIVCIIGFSIVGSPISQKAIRFDETRLNDFYTVKSAVGDYYTINKSLPLKISDLKFNSDPEAPKDPETKNSYIYQKVTDADYKLCATFSTDSEEELKKYKTDSYPNYSYSSRTETTHKKGYDCTKYTIPDYLKPYPTAVPAQQDSFKFLKPMTDENLCLGQSYEISWEADSAIKEVNLYINSTVNSSESYILAPYNPIPVNNISSLNSRWKGSRSWIVGNVFKDSRKIPGQVKPGKYKFGENPSIYISGVYNYYSNEFTISNCSSPSQTPVAQ